MVFMSFRVAEYENPIVRQIFDPQFHDPQPGVYRKFHSKVFAQCRVGNFDGEKDFVRTGGCEL